MAASDNGGHNIAPRAPATKPSPRLASIFTVLLGDAPHRAATVWCAGPPDQGNSQKKRRGGRTPSRPISCSLVQG